MSRPDVPPDPDPPGPHDPPGPAVHAGPPTIAGALERGRLRLDGLSPAARRAARLAIGVTAAACALVVAASLGAGVPGPAIDVPGNLVAEPGPVAVPVLAVVGALLALAAVAAILVLAALATPRRSSRLTVAGTGVALAAVTSPAAGLLGAAAIVSEADPFAWWPLAAGCAAALAACAALLGIAVAPGAWARRVPHGAAVGAVIAAVPGTALALATLAGLLGGGWSLPDPRPAGFEAYPATVHLGAAAVASALYTLLARLLPLLLLPIVLWEAATWARASREELASPVVARVDRRPALLAGLLAAKAGWLVLGFAGLLPASLGGASGAWARSLDAGAVAWAIAAGWAAFGCAWLARPDAPVVRDTDLRPGLRALVGGFSAGSVAGAALLVAGSVLLLLPDDRPAVTVIGLAPAARDLLIPVQVAAVAAGLVAGGWLLRRGRRAGAFLAVACAWIAPRAIGVLLLETGLVPPDWRSPVGVDLVTLDAAVTAGVAVLAALLLAGRRLGADAGSLALVLVVSTLMAHGATLLPAGLAAAVATSAIVFPPLRELLFGSAELNEPSAVRDARVLGSLGRQAAVLGVTAATFAVTGALAGDAAGELGRLLFGPPYAAFLVAAVVTERRAAREPAAARVAAPWTAHGGAAGVGLVGLALAVGLAALVVDPVAGRAWTAAAGDGEGPTPVPSAAPGASPGASAAPTLPSPSAAPESPEPSAGEAGDADALRALVAGSTPHLEAIRALTQGLGSLEGAALASAGDELAAEGEAGRAWLATQPDRACSRGYAAALDAYFGATAEVGRAIAAAVRGTGPEAAVTETATAFGAALDAINVALPDAAAACGLPLGSPAAPTP